MTLKELYAQIAFGEDSIRQFKADVRNGDSLAAEMTAFANSEGGMILIGVADDGSVPGLSAQDLQRINQLISNTASQGVRSPLTVYTQNIATETGRLVIVLKILKGLDKPYFDRHGVIWFKSGADKRRIQSKEELRRLFQISDQFYADELPTKASLDALDKLRFRDFLQEVYQQSLPESEPALLRLLQNMNLVSSDRYLNLAGVLLFATRPEWIKPQFIVKAVRYPGNQIHSNTYLDTEDCTGTLGKVFEDALAFVMRNLHKVQLEQSVNSPGKPEIPQQVFEELLVNALVHRDYLINAPVRIFIFDNRIEIISPGHLPNHLTVEHLRVGISNSRNPILLSYVAKGLLPYRGLGSGIQRALEHWAEIDFVDDRERCQFSVTIHRPALKAASQEKTSGKNVGEKRRGKTSGKILAALRENPRLTIPELAQIADITPRSIERNLQKLQQAGLLQRVGSAKTGHWELCDEF